MKIVLTGSPALMSDYNGTSYMGFVSALPTNILRERFAKKFFPTYSDESGKAKISNYSIAKIEATLLREYDRSEVIIADPRKLDRVVGEDTKGLGITCMDPLGVGYGTGIVNSALSLFGIKPRGPSYMSKSFRDILDNPAVKKFKPKIVVGGQATWQFVDFGVQDELGIDTVILGEGEAVAPQIFRKAVDGEELPKVVKGPDADPDEDILPIVTPSINGEVEITRGCGRGCKFCTPTVTKFKSIPLSTIEKEVKLNLEGGAKSIGLHSEDFLRYNAEGFVPNEDKVLNLFERVATICRGHDAGVKTDFVCASSVMCAPTLVGRIGKEYVNVDGRSFIEMGIETGSPEMLSKLMRGKAHPFKPEEYPEVVRDSITVLNEAGWTVVGTMITNLPEETEEDTIKSIELVDELMDLDVIIFVLPFIPMGELRREEQSDLHKILTNDSMKELFVKTLEKTTRQVKKDLPIVKGGIQKSIFAKLALGFAVRHMLRSVKKMKEKQVS